MDTLRKHVSFDTDVYTVSEAPLCYNGLTIEDSGVVVSRGDSSIVIFFAKELFKTALSKQKCISRFLANALGERNVTVVTDVPQEPCDVYTACVDASVIVQASILADVLCGHFGEADGFQPQHATGARAVDAKYVAPSNVIESVRKMVADVSEEAPRVCIGPIEFGKVVQGAEFDAVVNIEDFCNRGVEAGSVVYGGPDFGRGGSQATEVLSRAVECGATAVLVLPAAFGKSAIGETRVLKNSVVGNLVASETFMKARYRIDGSPKTLKVTVQTWTPSDSSPTAPTLPTGYRFTRRKAEANVAVKRIGSSCGNMYSDREYIDAAPLTSHIFVRAPSIASAEAIVKEVASKPLDRTYPKRKCASGAAFVSIAEVASAIQNIVQKQATRARSVSRSPVRNEPPKRAFPPPLTNDPEGLKVTLDDFRVETVS